MFHAYVSILKTIWGSRGKGGCVVGTRFWTVSTQGCQWVGEVRVENICYPFGDGTEGVRGTYPSHRKDEVNANEGSVVRVDRWEYIGKGANVDGSWGISVTRYKYPICIRGPDLRRDGLPSFWRRRA